MRKPLTLGRALDTLRDLHNTRETRLRETMGKARERFDKGERTKQDAILEQLSEADVKSLKSLFGETPETKDELPGWATEPKPEGAAPQVIERN